MEDKREGSVKTWTVEEMEGLGFQIRLLLDEMREVEARFECISVFHENFEMGYEERCLSNYNRDLEKIENAYWNVLEFVNQSPVKITYLRILRSVARYKLGSLYTIMGLYDKALPLLKKAIKEMEKHRLIPIMRYEYTDSCLKEGKCRIEKRDKMDKIIRCYSNAEKVINDEKEPEAIYYSSIELLVRKTDQNKWKILKADLELSWAVLFLDLYDRQMDKKAENLKNARLHLVKMYKILFNHKDCEKEGSLFFYKEKMAEWKKRMDEGEKEKTKSGREKEAHEKVWAAKRDRKMLLAYLATQGACCLKMAGDENEPDKADNYIRAMECYLAAYYCDLSNTIAMGNICYICYLNSNDGETERSFWEKIREDKNIDGLSVKFEERLREDIREKIRFKTEQLMVSECVKRIKQMIKQAWEYYQWEEGEALENEPGKHSLKVKVRNSTLVNTAVTTITDEVYYIINRQFLLTEMNIRNLRTVLWLLDSKLQWLEEIIERFFQGLWSLNPYISNQGLGENRQHRRPEGKVELKKWIYHGIEAELSDGIPGESDSTEATECWRNMIREIKTRAGEVFSKSGQEACTCNGEKCMGEELEEERKRQNQQMKDEIEDKIPSSTKLSDVEPTNQTLDLLELLDNGAGESPVLYRAILTSLSDVLRVENSNMYALNLKNCILRLLQQKPDRTSSDDSYKIYTNLRQSTLKKCFLSLDRKAHEEPCTLFYRGRLKQSFILFYNKVASFMDDFIRRRDNKEEVRAVGHYTKLSTLPLLIKKEEKTHFRLYNMEHLNDPEEGKIFIELLKNKAREKQAGENRMLHKIIEKYESDSFEKSGVYIGSFTGRLDNLNMWFQYGDEGNGCCMVVDADSTFDQDVNITLSHMYQSDSGEYFESLDSRYALYEVAYYPWGTKEGEAAADNDKTKEKVDDFANQVSLWINRIGIQAEELEKEAHLQKDELEELDLEIQKTVMLILDQARFLIKSKHYEEEKEYRVIKHSNSPDCDPNGKAVPRLYIEMKKPLVYSEVCLGPKVENPASIAAYVLNIQHGMDMQKGIRVKKSSIKIR